MKGDSQGWAHMWGAKVSVPCDMSQDQLKSTILKVKSVLEVLVPGDEPTQGMSEEIKKWLDENYGPRWHVVVGRNFGAHLVHQKHNYVFFYVGSIGVLVCKT